MRLQFTRVVYQDRMTHKERFKAAGSVISEVSKLAIDFIAECSGLNYRQIRTTREPSGVEMRAEWQQLWSKVNAA
jgi:hypothetical protein